MKMASFKNAATLHQLEYFQGKNQLGLEKEGRAQDHWLNREAAEAGMTFYSGYDISKYVREEFRKNKKDTPEWYYDTLRSQHIPFNFFVPFHQEKELCKKVFNDLLKLNILELQQIEFEFPSREDNPLGDNTSFDTYIEYMSGIGKKGFLGIEMKYTESGYSPGKTETENYPFYHECSRGDYYYNSDEIELESNRFRQVWRNHLLAVKLAEKEMFHLFHAITFYPSSNKHFKEVMTDYPANFLTDKGKTTLSGISYEEYFKTLEKHAENSQQREWIKYLVERYLVGNRERVVMQIEKGE